MIYSSDLPRAKTSAQIIQSQLKDSCPLEEIPSLREWQLGKLEGAKFATLEAIYPEQLKAFRTNLAKFDSTMFGAESVYQTTQRTTQFIKSLESKPFEHVMIVGHGANNPVGIRQKHNYPIFIDQTALQLNEMIVSAGEVGHSIIINPQDLASFVKAEFADILEASN